MASEARVPIEMLPAALLIQPDSLIRSLLCIPHVFVAGGFVVNSCVAGLSNTEFSDIDVWVCAGGLSIHDRKTSFDAAAAILFNQQGGAVAGIVSKSVMTFSIAGYPRNVQVIMSKAVTPHELTRNFDIDACRAYMTIVGDVVTCRAHPEALFAWEHRTIFDTVPQVKALRLIKWNLRGFQIGFHFQHNKSLLEVALFLKRSRFAHDPADSHMNIAKHMQRELDTDIVCFDLCGVQMFFLYRRMPCGAADLTAEYQSE